MTTKRPPRSSFRRIVDLGRYVTRPTTPIRTLLAAFNDLPHAFQIVANDSGAPIGTLTDGDIRRGILAGATLDDPVSRCMVTRPVIGRLGEEERHVGMLKSLVFIPLVDQNGKLRQIMVRSDVEPGLTTALLMAGGLGTRLGERTRDIPKPLLPVGGKPIIEHILTALEEAGVGRIIVSVHHLAHKIEAYLDSRKSGCQIEILKEPERLGTAGALGLLAERLSEPVLVLNADVVTSVNIAAMSEFFARNSHDATIAVAQHKVRIPFGVVKHDGDGLFDGVDEKPELSHFVTAGIYLLSPEFAALVSRGEAVDMPELLNRGRALGLRIGLFPIHEYWTDVGTPDALDAADSHLANFSNGKT